MNYFTLLTAILLLQTDGLTRQMSWCTQNNNYRCMKAIAGLSEESKVRVEFGCCQWLAVDSWPIRSCSRVLNLCVVWDVIVGSSTWNGPHLPGIFRNVYRSLVAAAGWREICSKGRGDLIRELIFHIDWYKAINFTWAFILNFVFIYHRTNKGGEHIKFPNEPDLINRLMVHENLINCD